MSIPQFLISMGETVIYNQMLAFAIGIWTGRRMVKKGPQLKKNWKALKEEIGSIGRDEQED